MKDDRGLSAHVIVLHHVQRGFFMHTYVHRVPCAIRIFLPNKISCHRMEDRSGKNRQNFSRAQKFLISFAKFFGAMMQNSLAWRRRDGGWWRRFLSLNFKQKSNIYIVDVVVDVVGCCLASVAQQSGGMKSVIYAETGTITATIIKFMWIL